MAVVCAQQQQQPVRRLPVKVPKGWKAGDAEPLEKQKSDKLVGNEKMLQGLSLSFDLYNLATRFLGSYGGPEAALRINLWHTYFPVFEAGVGMTNHTDGQTNINYKTNAPYFRIGVDKNMLRNKKDFARLYAGFRYGFSSFKYSVKAPPQIDPIWGGEYSLNQSNVASTWGWLELGLGIDVKVLRFVHLGLGARYKVKLHTTKNENSEPWYVPGFGTSGSRWALNYNLIFDLSRGSGKQQLKEGETLPPEQQLKRGKPDGKTRKGTTPESEEAAKKAQEAHEKAEAAHKEAEKASKEAKQMPEKSGVPKAVGKRSESK